MVLPGVAEFTRVCAYDRPGLSRGQLIDEDGEIFTPAAATPSPSPAPLTEMVDELHALLQAAEVPGPYVLAGHSLGGFIARLYASDLPRRGRRPRPGRRLLRGCLAVQEA